MEHPQVFISYSCKDKGYVLEMETDLKENDIDVWIDQWEISPNDSLIQKIFSEGLGKSDFFLILLSEFSVNSKWVKEELNDALIKNIEGVTRVILIKIGKVKIPCPLKTLKLIDMTMDYKKGLNDLINTIYDVQKTPSSNFKEKTPLKKGIGGLSKTASTLGTAILKDTSNENYREKKYSTHELQSLVPNINPKVLNAAIGELEDYGLVKVIRALGTFPYDFLFIMPTYAFYLHFESEIPLYNPEEDIKSVANIINKKGEIDKKTLQSELKIPPVRINRAVKYLEDYAIIKVIRTISGDFIVVSTRFTNQFVEKNCN